MNWGHEKDKPRQANMHISEPETMDRETVPATEKGSLGFTNVLQREKCMGWCEKIIMSRFLMFSLNVQFR